VAQRRADPRDDLVTALTQAHDSDGATLSGPELIANLVLLLVAGFETTTNLLGTGSRCCCHDPTWRLRSGRIQRWHRPLWRKYCGTTPRCS
jgi:cytochrome P450